MLFLNTLLLFPTFQSCQKNNDIYGKFLDVDINHKNFTTEEIIIMKEAKERLDDFVSYNKRKKQFNINIKSGTEIMISERLFNFFIDKIEYTNNILRINNIKYQKGKVFINLPKTKKLIL